MVIDTAESSLINRPTGMVGGQTEWRWRGRGRAKSGVLPAVLMDVLPPSTVRGSPALNAAAIRGGRQAASFVYAWFTAQRPPRSPLGSNINKGVSASNQFDLGFNTGWKN